MDIFSLQQLSFYTIKKIVIVSSIVVDGCSLVNRAYGFCENDTHKEVFFSIHQYAEPDYPSMHLRKQTCRYMPEKGMVVCGILSDVKLALDAWFVPSPQFTAFYRSMTGDETDVKGMLVRPDIHFADVYDPNVFAENKFYEWISREPFPEAYIRLIGIKSKI